MITSTSTTQAGNVTIVSVVSSLSGTVFFHWYVDGVYAGQTTTPSRAFALGADDQSRIDVLDTNDPAFDPIANAPAGYPARRTLVFTRSLSAVARYRIEQQAAGGTWEPLGYVQDDAKQWVFQFDTPRLNDLTLYAWRAIPIDGAGNDGTAVSLGSELIVRTPDSPRFSATLQVSTKVLFAAA